MMKVLAPRGRWSLVFAALLALPGMARAFDYPTIDRVEYVHGCMRDNPEHPQEMVYKCACLIDAIAKQMPYEEFVEASTAAYAYTIGGERGETVRAYAPAKAMADHFKEVQARGKKSCFFH
ncbi:MAG: hypothetical protein ABI277_19195 [Burkholderiaceae bacterium]